MRLMRHGFHRQTSSTDGWFTAWAGCAARSLGLLACLLPLFLVGCLTGLESARAASTVHYVVTVKPLELILREVCGTRAKVTTLLKAGANAHTYDPTPADAKAVQTATALLWVGEDYDGWAGELNTRQSLQLLPLLPRDQLLTLAEACEHDHGQGHAHHHHAVDDPHFFTDPLLVKALLPALVRELGRLDPAGQADYASGATAFGKQLDALHAELAELLLPLKGRPVIQFHASFNYFIHRYSLLNAGVVEEFPGKEPSPKYLQGIVKQIREQQITALFSETLLPRGPAQVIGEAAGVPVFELDPSCGTSERSYASYSAWLGYNAQIFVKALS